MTEKIGVTYLSVLGGNAWHMALFYENSAGQKRVIEAAPQFDMGQLPPSVQVGEVIKETFSSTNTNNGSPYGFIVGGDRPWSDLPPKTTMRVRPKLLSLEMIYPRRGNDL